MKVPTRLVLANRVRQNFYLDSVALMRIAQQLESAPDVESAALMIGTPANKDILAGAGLLAESGRAATPNDLIIGIRAATDAVLDAALAQAETRLQTPLPGSRSRGGWRPKMLRSGVKELPGANLALISVPGEFAAAEARKALRAGLHVLLFSDNVSLDDEIELKVEAHGRGLLCMGPDCGSALIDGVPLAFANAVPRGAVGLISASGTGLQEVSTLIARMGGGISHAIGTGSRDLHQRVGAITTLMAIDALEADARTEHIVLISKPPAQAVAEAVLARVAQSRKPFTICFLGLEQLQCPGNASSAATLREAAQQALGANVPPDHAATASPSSTTAASAPSDSEPMPIPPLPRGWVRGLFSGGTLCAEAQVIFKRAGHKVQSNVPIPGAQAWRPEESAAHKFLDLGSDEFTVGRPHPMIEPDVRNTVLRESLRDESVAVILVDIVLGYGAHENPAGSFAAVVEQGGGRAPAVVASVCGTEGDPQGLSAQIELLRGAGVHVAASNAGAAELALRLAEGSG